MPTREELLREEMALLEEEERLLLKSASTKTGSLMDFPVTAAGVVSRAMGMKPVGATVGDVVETVGNIPRSAASFVGGLVQLATSPVQTAKTIGKAALGAPEAVGRAVGLVKEGAPSEGATLATGIGKDIFSKAADPGKYLRQDPVGFALDVSGASSAGRLATLGKAGGKAGALNPVRLFGKAAMLPAKGAKAVGNVVEDVVGFTTGKGRRVFEESFGAGKAGGAQREALRAGRRGEMASEQVAETAIEGFKKLKEKRDTAFREALPNLHLKTPSDPVNLTDIKRGLPEILERFGIRVDGKEALDRMTSTGNTAVSGSADLSKIVKLDFSKYPSLSKGEHAQIQRVVDAVMKSSTNTPTEAYTLLRQSRSANAKARLLGNTTASKALTGIEDLLRSELGKKVAGFDEMMKKFSEETTMLEQMQKSLSIQGQTNETLMTKLTNMLNDRENLDLRRRLVNELEEVTGEPIKTQIAGIRTSDPFSGGLGGSVIRGAGLLGIGSGVLPLGTLALLPFTSPRAMGRFFETIGANAKKAEAVQQAMQKIEARIPTGMITDGLTVGAVLQRIGEEAEEQQPTVSMFPQRTVRR